MSGIGVLRLPRDVQFGYRARACPARAVASADRDLLLPILCAAQSIDRAGPRA